MMLWLIEKLNYPRFFNVSKKKRGWVKSSGEERRSSHCWPRPL